MANNDIKDKWLIVYQGTLDFYKRDYNIDSYKNKLVLVTGDKTASGERDQTSYLCIDDDTHSVHIPIPAIYLRGIGIGKNTYGFPDSILKFASANGINVSLSGEAVTIGINDDTLGKIDSIDNKVEQTAYDDKVAELETSIADNKDYIDKEVVRLEGYAEEVANAAETVAKTYTDGKIEAVEEAIGGKYTKPAGGIPVKDLVNEVATKTEVGNAISVVATDLNDKIDSKVGKTDLKDLKYTVNEKSYTYNGLSEATMPQIFTPTSRGMNGQILQSKGGGVPQWTNLSEIKEAIGFAKDLTGVIEATPEEFTFRPSAGNKSIRDEGAVIRRIKGNTTVWGQLADINEVYNSGAKYIMETGDGWFSIQRDLSNPNTPYCGVVMDNKYAIPAHIYLLSQEIEVSGIVTDDDYCSAVAYNFTSNSTVYYKQNGKYLYTKIVTKTNDTTFRFFYYAYGNAKLKASNLQCFDLTSIFGAGNEPTTYEDFKAIYPDIYPYCEPTIRNLNTTAIETVGFNLFNGEYADLIGGKTYYVGGADITGLTFTPQGSSTSFNIVLGTDRTFTPTQSGRLYSTKVNTCVHFQHTGIKDGECADYVKHTLELPEIAEYFPNGMNGIGDVCDEINSENAVTRIGRVDLGTLAWEETSHKGLYGVTISDGKEQKKVNIITHKYPYKGDKLGVADTSFEDKSLFNYYNANNLKNALRIYIKDTSYSDVNAFKAAMSGIDLYYELAVPEIRPILEPIQLVYDVEDFGTERAIAPENSAPFRADIVYQFNAEGRIRDNGRNIERLENKISSYHDDGVMVTIDREIITTKSIIGNSEFRYALPDAPQDVKGDADGTLATEFWVRKNIPTEIATATQKLQANISLAGALNASPNIVYEFPSPLSVLTIETLQSPSGDYDHVWIIRFSRGQIFNITIKPTVRWKDGIAPTFETNTIYELIFKQFNNQTYFGEWKAYKQ